MAARVVCISQTTGSGGEDVGRAVAQGLGYRYVDEEIVARAAAKHGLDQGLVADAERRKSFLKRWLEELRDSPGLDLYYAYGVVGVADEPGATAASDTLRSVIREAVWETADEGDVVIVSHAASIALAGQDDVLRSLVTASRDVRAGRLAAGPLDMKEAAKQIEQADAARASYLARFYDVERESATHYDLVVSTDVLSAEDAARIVVYAAGLRNP